MIPIADLQIGNRVLYNGMEAIVYSIRGPYPDVSERFNNKATVDLYLGGLITATEDEIYPIILSRDILVENLKFKQQGESNSFINGEVKLVLEDDNWKDVCFDLYIRVYIKCLSTMHELQNTYKTLFNDDLLP
jgi:hypothetical protein